LNADLIATSTVGTGIGSAAQWCIGRLRNLRVIGNGANQTAATASTSKTWRDRFSPHH